MSTAGIDRLALLNFLSQSLAVVITLAEYEFCSKNDDLVARFHFWYSVSVDEIRITPDQGLCDLYQKLKSIPKIYDPGTEIIDTHNLLDVSSIFGRYISQRVFAASIVNGNPVFTTIVSRVLSHDVTGIAMKYHTNREAFSFIVEASIIFLDTVCDRRRNAILDSLKFLNGLSLNPSLDLS